MQFRFSSIVGKKAIKMRSQTSLTAASLPSFATYHVRTTLATQTLAGGRTPRYITLK